ncbi:hypothetical protein JH06_4838 [Blastocystis sp. subtype 4]|uniref:hypothetical protein n=1 Tax=Blastocystis sp. subtype 4 TaxID=944170 RepID=UPI000711B95F|nr:hypothetical protein JH06_4838 [Blastocystis sp. subtype 4]KNB41701.1 hypothetical protein JH06_4838 [Blastocystis sp. subtype 4]|eukprot:XP_014525144.1 hypothetical protein JH06_4838 [Blastocystis sp. subtype 4]
MLYFLVLLFLSLQFANALTINLSGGKQQCIWEEGSIGDQLFASYEVTKGNYHNLVVSIKDSYGKQIYSASGKEEDDFIFNFESSIRVTLCFSTPTKEDVSVSFRYQLGNDVKPINRAPREEYVTSNDVNNLADKLQAISTEIYAMQDEQRYTGEKQHNYKSDLVKLKRKIIISNLFEAIVMLLCCLLQYFQYRSMIQI